MLTKKTDMPPIVRQSPGRLKSDGAGRQLSDIKFKNGDRGRQCSASSKSYWMTDKAGHLCRFTKISKCNTLQATDYKDPPVIVVAVHRTDGK